MRHCGKCSRTIDETESSYKLLDGMRVCVSCVCVESASVRRIPESEDRMKILGIGLNYAQWKAWAGEA